MEDIQCLNMFAYILGSIVLCVFMLLCGHFLGGRSSSRSKNIPFESGIESIGNARIQFSIKFYVIAMIFVIFDIESMYLYAWSISIRETGWIGFIEVFIFIFVLLVSLIYLMRGGVFDWVNRSLSFEIDPVNYLNIDISKFLKRNLR